MSLKLAKAKKTMQSFSHAKVRIETHVELVSLCSTQSMGKMLINREGKKHVGVFGCVERSVISTLCVTLAM
jgi:hypothetical protein